MVKGEAESAGKKLIAKAEATRFTQAVGAFGTPDAYNAWVFATGLPENVKLKLLYAGKGTLWTDLKSMSVIMNQDKEAKETK